MLAIPAQIRMNIKNTKNYEQKQTKEINLLLLG